MIRIGTTQDLADTVSLLRQLAGITQTALAEVMGCHPARIGEYERHRRKVSVRVALIHLNALGYELAVVPLKSDAPRGQLSATESAEPPVPGVLGRTGGDLEAPRGSEADRASWVAGYDRAVAVLNGVAARSGSEAARWAADYLAADPDRWRMNEHCWHSTDGSECPGSGPNCAPGGAA